MSASAFEVAQIVQQYGHAYIEKHQPRPFQLRVLHAIAVCRTAALGGHADACDSCGHVRISYNSCRNRHCPKCQGVNGERWNTAQQKQLLPVPIFMWSLPCLRN